MKPWTFADSAMQISVLLAFPIDGLLFSFLGSAKSVATHPATIQILLASPVLFFVLEGLYSLPTQPHP